MKILVTGIGYLEAIQSSVKLFEISSGLFSSKLLFANIDLLLKEDRATVGTGVGGAEPVL